MKLNGRTLIEILPLSELYTVYRAHDRLKVFANKGRECVICDREGTLLLVTEESTGRKHVDLYTDDFILMTVDHITPKKVCKELGWSKSQQESLDNKQAMCDPCNNKKGDKHLTNEQFRERRLRNGYPHKLARVEVIRQLVDNSNISNKSLEGVI